jgi:CubicO group peptidase (beta-lactamase class C family)
VLERAYGSADLEHDAANSVRTIFEAGSASKQVTAAALLLLVREGVLSLDDDVRKHVPELPAYGAPITLRHLLHHTSGLRDWRYVVGLAGERLGARVHSNLDALAIAARQKALNHAPGAEHATPTPATA